LTVAKGLAIILTSSTNTGKNMPRLVSVTITTLVDDNVDTGALADVMFNVAEGPTQEWADVNGWSVELMDAEVTLNVEAE
jgi:hypothetical protein